MHRAETPSEEFRDAVGAVARRGDAPIAEIANDFGISESCLRYWLAAVYVAEGHRPGVTASESAELRELKRRNRLIEQEDEIQRRAAAHFAQAHPGTSPSCCEARVPEASSR